jgi:hypothetical protein
VTRLPAGEPDQDGSPSSACSLRNARVRRPRFCSIRSPTPAWMTARTRPSPTGRGLPFAPRLGVLRSSEDPAFLYLSERPDAPEQRGRAAAGSASFASQCGHRLRYAGSIPTYLTSLVAPSMLSRALERRSTMQRRPRRSGSHQTPCWRRQSRANPSQFPDPRENTGNLRQAKPSSGGEPDFSAVIPLC